VTRLVRESIGSITLAGLKEGQWRSLTSREIKQLLNDFDSQKR
jgi:16S rRNA U516 pseudouridylate synthase RsuA-like enzyme